METKLLPISQVFPNIGQVKGLPKNPRFIRDEKYKKLVQSIKDDPEMLELRELIVYDTDDPSLGYVVVGGNMRYRAMKELGYKEVPAKVLHTGFPLEKMRRIILKDNSSFGETDFQLLIDEWSMDEIELAAIDIPEIGEAVEDEPKGDVPTPQEESTVEEDESFNEDEVSENEYVQEGDLWKIGRHLLVCGDSTSEESVQKLFRNGELCDCWITDPPYGISYGEKKAFLDSQYKDISDIKDSNIENDDLKADELQAFLVAAFTQAKNVMKAGASYYIFHSDTYGYYFRGALIEVGDMDLRENLIWNKNSLVLSRQDYHYKHEPCLYGWKLGAGHNWYTDRKQTTVIDWDRPTKSALHPTMKPVGLIGYLMKNSTKKGDVVYDSFGGSGTTMIAAEQLGRSARLCELMPHYCKVILLRMIQLRGFYHDIYRINPDGTSTRIEEIFDKEELESYLNKE